MHHKQKSSRRDFLKAAVLGLGAAFLAACERALGSTPTPSPIPTLTPTGTPEPGPPDPPTATPLIADTPTATAISCFKLLTPENGAILSAMGKVTFSWEAMPGAIGYKLEITFPTGQKISFDTQGLSRDQYLEAFKMAGVFHWKVTAFGANSVMLCTAEPFTFEKEKAPALNNGEGGDGNGVGAGMDGGPTTGGGIGTDGG